MMGGGNGGIASTFLTSALDTIEWSALHPGRLTSGKRELGVHWRGGVSESNSFKKNYKIYNNLEENGL
jgi:hypothetical protein